MKHLLITRPIDKGNELFLNLEAAGFKVSHTPVLALDYLDVAPAQLAVIDEADVVIFISQDAVKGLATLRDTLPASTQYVAVGTSTASVLKTTFGVQALVPKQQDTEGMLALNVLADVSGKQIVIVKGQGGRPDLAKSLKSRGALLNQLAVYERKPAELQSDEWLDLWKRSEIDGIVITSNAAADAIFNSTQEDALSWLKGCTFFVVSQRIALHLQETYRVQGDVIVTDGAQDEVVFKAILSARQALAIQQELTSALEQTESERLPPDTSSASTLSPIQKATQTAKEFTSVHIEPDHTQESTMSEQPQHTTSSAAMGAKTRIPVSKVGILALTLAMMLGGAGAAAVWYGEQQLSAMNERATALQQENAVLQQQVVTQKAQLAKLNQAISGFDEQLSRTLSAQQSLMSDTLAQVKEVASLPQQQFAKSEAAYLVHLLRFKAVVEHDWQTSEILLSRLDKLAVHFAEPHVISAAIAQDLVTIRGQENPPLETAYVTLMGLVQQASELPLLTLKLPEENAVEQVVLSEDVNDWQANLKRSWDKFAEDFIRIRKRETITAEPLLSASEQRLLRAAFEAYLTQAQTALMKQQTAVYQSALHGAIEHLNTHFDTNAAVVKGMTVELERLAGISITTDTQIKLVTPDVIEGLIQ
ncbi:uroporphyrinogen-III synthase [Pseudoalteromonas xiamenensis]|uniref:uroporphyrinogen-III C-methyltransferase n=1 Tax=Pseudoalteromonas xiamenensis TaxID=882626 RepID=UPI0027E43A3C|nr:uroporphyrinogen-III C-methyltransferase [Pseudoalteromonas xiamenensis]WMN58498.1 uroporphyrinogen-III synthase [Pseudoalteromonas xiamenensis]